MPLYEFRCAKCGAKKEVIRRIAERDRPLVCSECRGSCAREMFPGTNVVHGSVADREAQAPGRLTAVSVDAPVKATFAGNTFIGMDRAISADPGASISVRGNRFKNVRVPVERRRK